MRRVRSKALAAERGVPHPGRLNGGTVGVDVNARPRRRYPLPVTGNRQQVRKQIFGSKNHRQLKGGVK